MSTDQNHVQQAVIATLSPDRCGITAEVTDFLCRNQANVEGSYATRLGGLYGEYIHFSAPPRAMATIEHTYTTVLATLNPTFVPTVAAAEPGADHKFDLNIYAWDQRGLLSSVTALLREAGVNVLSVAGCSYSAPQQGNQLFVVDMKIDIASSVALPRLCADLDALSSQNGWDLTLKPADSTRTHEAETTTSPFPPSRAQSQPAFSFLQGGVESVATVPAGEQR